MKKLLTIFFVGLTAISFGQSEGKWSVGVGYTPSIVGGQTFTGYINRHLGDKWQVGVMPFGWFNKYTSPNPNFTSDKSVTVGLNLSSRFFPFKHKIFRPYLYSYLGFGYSQTKYEGGYIGSVLIKGNILDFSLGLGVETSLFQSNWAIDANIGYLNVTSDTKDRTYSQISTIPLFSIGILKRFGK